MVTKNSKIFEDLYGCEISLLRKQELRYSDLKQKFNQTFGQEDIQYFSSPGRTEIGGNHTDHNSGKVLTGAVNLDNLAIVARNGSNTIHIVSNGYQRFKVDLNKLTPDKNEFFTSAALVRGICSKLNESGHKIGGFNAYIDSEVPKGSGLSSSASFEVLIGTIISNLFNGGNIDPVEIAKTAQFAENVFFGKPCGLMDQIACSLGGLISIDFKDPSNPQIRKINFDFNQTDLSLVITDTGGNHADLNDEYASLPYEMMSVANSLGVKVLREASLDKMIMNIPALRDKTGDRAILRSIHFYEENQRVASQIKALEKNDIPSFLELIISSGNSSFMYNQNVYPVTNVKEQGLSLALALSERVLKGKGAWRVHGGGFAGTIQAFVPGDLLKEYVNLLESIFGKHSCRILFIRKQGAMLVDF